MRYLPVALRGVCARPSLRRLANCCDPSRGPERTHPFFRLGSVFQPDVRMSEVLPALQFAFDNAFPGATGVPMIQFTGIGDEAGNPLAAQISATKALGWSHIELRNVQMPGHTNGNVHDIPEEAFEALAETLETEGVRASGFGSTIGNWASQITDPFEATLERVDRAIPRMQRLGAKVIRVMSYAVRKDADGNDLPDQMADERFRRLRELKSRFDDAGLTMVHENCMNYGGMSIGRAMETLENVPGLRWVFDTCNPIFNGDRDRPGRMQDPWEFYQAVKSAISHIHIKDGRYNLAK